MKKRLLKLISICLCLAMIGAFVAGCTTSEKTKSDKSSSDSGDSSAVTTKDDSKNSRMNR